MRRFSTVAIWLLATVGATTLAWQAVDAVGVAASGEFAATVVATVAPQPADSVGAGTPNDIEPTQSTSTTRATSSTTTAPASATTGASTTASPSSTTTRAAAGQSAGTTTAAPAPPPETTNTVPSSTTSPTTTSATSIPPAPSSSTTTSTLPPGPEPDPSIETFNLTGGSVTVFFSATDVHVVVAEPNDGFELRNEDFQKTATDVVVRFDSPTHQSKIRARWLAGPTEEIED